MIKVKRKGSRNPKARAREGGASAFTAMSSFFFVFSVPPSRRKVLGAKPPPEAGRQSAGKKEGGWGEGIFARLLPFPFRLSKGKAEGGFGRHADNIGLGGYRGGENGYRDARDEGPLGGGAEVTLNERNGQHHAADKHRDMGQARHHDCQQTGICFRAGEFLFAGNHGGGSCRRKR